MRRAAAFSGWGGSHPACSSVLANVQLQGPEDTWGTRLGCPPRDTDARVAQPSGHPEALLEDSWGAGWLAAKGRHGGSPLSKVPDASALSLTTLFLWILTEDAKPGPLLQETHQEISRFSSDSVFQALGNVCPVPGQDALGSSILHNLCLCLFSHKGKKKTHFFQNSSISLNFKSLFWLQEPQSTFSVCVPLWSVLPRHPAWMGLAKNTCPVNGHNSAVRRSQARWQSVGASAHHKGHFYSNMTLELGLLRGKKSRWAERRS